MDYERFRIACMREMFEMGGNPLKDDLLKYGIITEEDILKAGILRDMEKAKAWLKPNRTPASGDDGITADQNLSKFIAAL